MAAKIKSIAKINAYEKSELLIIFLPVLILSSSPKLNFFIKIPVPTATAAAGVESFKIQLSILLNALSNFETSLGVAAKTLVPKLIAKTKLKINITIK